MARMALAAAEAIEEAMLRTEPSMERIPFTSPWTMFRPIPDRLMPPTMERIEEPMREKMPGTWPTVLETLDFIEFTCWVTDDLMPEAAWEADDFALDIFVEIEERTLSMALEIEDFRELKLLVPVDLMLLNAWVAADLAFDIFEEIVERTLSNLEETSLLIEEVFEETSDLIDCHFEEASLLT